MKKLFKIIRIIGIIISIILMSIITVSFINHQINLKKENSLLIAPGDIVEVNSNNLHVYSEGQGSETLVFMAGGGTTAPALDFKSLFSLFSDKYKIAVVEKAGYGFSDNFNSSRDIDTILEESRLALEKAGLKAPYTLFAHSMSGIEALYWAFKYPEEVKGIIGLDMVVPETYEDYSVNKLLVNLSGFGARIGITRFIPAIVNNSAAIKNGSLNIEDKNLYKAIFYSKTMTKPMINEVLNIKENAKKVKDKNVETPLLFFISNGKETGWDETDWINYQIEYIKKSNNEINKYIQYDVSHYIHNIVYKEIAEESINYIENIIN